MRVRFSIKKPAGIRKSFAITRDSVDLDGTRSQKAIEDKELIAVNENLRLGLIKLPEATRLCCSTTELPWKLCGLSPDEVGGMGGVAVKCIDTVQNPDCEGS